MKSLVLLSFLSFGSSSTPSVGPAEFFDDRQACETRMQALRQQHPVPGSIRCACHKTVEEVDVEGSDGI